MANKQTRRLAKLGLGTKVIKGTDRAVGIDRPNTKGRAVHSGFDNKSPENKRTSPWRGCGPGGK